MPNRSTAAEQEATDQEAIELLDPLYRTACRLLLDTALAAEAVEAAYRGAQRSERGPALRVSLFRSLFRIVRSKRSGWFARLWRTGVKAQSSGEELVDRLDEMPPDLREVVVLVDVEGFSYEDAGAVLDLAPDIIASRLSAGRRLLCEGFVGVRVDQPEAAAV